MTKHEAMTGLRSLQRQRGMTFVEVAVVLAIVGLLSWASFGAYDTMTDQRSRQQAVGLTLEMQAHLRSFSLRHARLPCPDPSALATGYEGMLGGGCSAGNQVGWFPYVSLGLAMPKDGLKARYAVFRAASASAALDADLAVTKERTGDVAEDVRFKSVGDLIVALNNVNFSASHAYLTGDGGRAGAINCSGNQVTAVAYWIVVPLSDRSGNGDRLDPPHALSSVCATNPAAPVRSDSDDVVLAESSAQLAGWLRSSLP